MWLGVTFVTCAGSAGLTAWASDFSTEDSWATATFAAALWALWILAASVRIAKRCVPPRSVPQFPARFREASGRLPRWRPWLG